MSDTIRPRRSVLYMPGANARALDKAKTLAADSLILDLEDSVAPDAKEDARALVAQKVTEGGYGPRELIIRINALTTPWGEADLKAAVEARPHAILAPKVDSAETVMDLSRRLSSAGAPPTVHLWIMMETPLAMLRAESIAAAATQEGSRLTCFVMGTNDLAKELHCTQTADRLPLLGGLGLSLLAARAYGLTIIDGVYNDIKDLDGFTQVCRQGAQMGFDGKTLIHPTQIDPCNRIFRPSDPEVGDARKIIAAFDLPENKGKGVVTVDGTMVELLHAENAKRIVAIADAIEAFNHG
ncbi:MAG: CoA ester lyase [Pseudomonadota bacterium]